MKPIIAIPIMILAAGATSAITYKALEKPAALASETGLAPDVELQLSESLARLEKEIGELRRENEQRISDPGSSARLALDDREIEAALERVLARREAPPTAVSAGDSPEELEQSDFDSEAALAALLNPELDWDDREAMWVEYAKAGRLDEMVALFEEYAADHANDPDVQVELGGAYLQKVFEAGSGPQAGVWAMKADGAFDDALALDEQHWDARFSKATSLSFWPPALGKQGEAIKHFEILATQQEASPLEPEHAQTYLMLGNTYQQIGNTEKALAAWKKGLELFPGNTTLAEQIANAGG